MQGLNRKKLIRNEQTILITQCTLSAISALSMNIPAVAIHNMDEGALHTFKIYFYNKNVVIAFSNTPKAYRTANNFANLLLEIVNSVHVVRWPDYMQKGEHLFEFFSTYKKTVDDLNKLLVKVKTEKTLPLRREIPPPPPFPFHVLPPVMRGMLEVMAKSIQAPEALIGQSLLAAASLAVQAHVDIVIDGRVFPSSNFFLTVASSGERKSAVDSIALIPIREYERELDKQQKELISEYKRDLLVWESLKKAALRSSAPATALKELGDPPQKPLDAMLLVEEPTYESVVVKLREGQPSIGIFSDEAGKFLGGFAFGKDNQLKTAAGFSKFWDGSPITRSRVSDGNYTLHGRRVSVHLMFQDIVAQQLFANELVTGQGLLSRCLVAYPDSRIGQRKYEPINIANSPEVIEYNQALKELLETPYSCTEGSLNELLPYALKLSKQAKESWVSFHDYVEGGMANNKPFYPIRGFAAKAAEHAARLAAVLTIVNDKDAKKITSQWMNAGVALVEYYLAEALRLFNFSQESPDLLLAEKVHNWLQIHYPVFSLVELYQNGPNSVRNKQKAAQIVSILEDHNLVKPLNKPRVINGLKRKKVWEIVRVTSE